MIKDTCFHPCSVASGDSTMIQCDSESQESLEKEKAKSEFVLSYNETAFFFLLAIWIFYRKLEILGEMLVYSKYIFMLNLFHSFFFFPQLDLSFIYIESCCRGYFFPLHVFHVRDLK